MEKIRTIQDIFDDGDKVFGYKHCNKIMKEIICEMPEKHERNYNSTVKYIDNKMQEHIKKYVK